MNNGNEQYMSPGGGRLCVRPGRAALCCLAFFALSFIVMAFAASAQTAVTAVAAQRSAHFRIGEKLTYYVSFAKFENSAYAELFVASSGKLGGVDAVELRSKIKTLDMVSAAFFTVDESRVVYAS